MSVVHSREERTYGAVTGWQERIRGTCVSLGATAPTLNDVSGSAVASMVDLVGRTLAAGTYYFFLACSGAAAVDVTLRASANATNIDATNTKVYRTLSDNVTEKMNATGSSSAVTFATFANGTQQTASITTLRGERGALLKLVTTGSVTIDQADYSAL